MIKISYIILFAAISTLVACGHSHSHDGDPGTLALTVNGGEFIEQGIPTSAFDDGWSVAFDNFLVSVGDLEVGHGHETPEVVFEDATYRVFDLAKSSGGSGFAVTSTEVDGGHYDHYRFRVAPSAGAAIGNADQADFDAFQAGAYAVWIKGSATDGTATKTFEWGFTASTLYNHCHTDDANVDGDTATVELTMHGDQLFQDALHAVDAGMLFQSIADADGDADDVITQAELAGFDITSGGIYDPAMLAIDNLWDFIDIQVSSMARLNGDGLCGVAAQE